MVAGRALPMLLRLGMKKPFFQRRLKTALLLGMANVKGIPEFGLGSLSCEGNK